MDEKYYTVWAIGPSGQRMSASHHFETISAAERAARRELAIDSTIHILNQNGIEYLTFTIRGPRNLKHERYFEKE